MTNVVVDTTTDVMTDCEVAGDSRWCSLSGLSATLGTVSDCFSNQSTSSGNVDNDGSNSKSTQGHGKKNDQAIRSATMFLIWPLVLCLVFKMYSENL